MRVAGVDGYKGGWIAVAINGGDFSSARVLWGPSLRSVILENAVELAVVDIPIGLSSGPEGRSVESAIRAYLVGKASSAFNTPCRQALEMDSYPEASAVNMEILGKKLSKQTWAIVPKIREADDAVRSLGQSTIVEGHPEVSFAAFCGKPILSSKKSAGGLLARLGVLSDLGFDLKKLGNQLPVRHAAAADDLVDAAILSWSALRIATNQNISFPANPSRDSVGLKMAVLA